MTVFHYFHAIISDITTTLHKENVFTDAPASSKFVVEPPKDVSHGDLATNVALVFSKEAKKSPRDLAALYKTHLETNEHVHHIDIAGPGFINITLKDSFWYQQLSEILATPEAKMGSVTIGKGEKVNVEYVSTNPTGPLHIGHCRVAVVGDVLANLLQKSGFDVVKEFYINDAGGQANDLARSTYKRYLQALGHSINEIGAYGGDYLIPVGESLAKDIGNKYENKDESIWLADIRAYAIQAMMDLIKKDLSTLNIFQDVFTSELELVKAGRVNDVIDDLRSRNLVYEGVLEKPKGKEIDDWEPRKQTLFRSEQFGDDVDRALMKSDGSWTYFASDMAYHLDKWQRGTSKLINVWGADHGGYVKRLTAAVRALSDDQASVHCVLCQMVRFIAGGQVLKMSKRDGNYITVDEAVNKVGLDAIRFLMVSRKNDAFMDFDFEKAIEQSKDNPVFYVQYAHARCHSIRRHIHETFPDLDISDETLSKIDLSANASPEFISVIKKLAEFERIIETAAIHYEPHRIPYYLNEVASAFHGLWNKGKDDMTLRFIDPKDPEFTQKNFAIVVAVAKVIKSGLALLGVTAPESM